MGGSQLDNVAMDLDGFLRTVLMVLAKNPRGFSIHVGRYPYVNGMAREHLRGCAEEEHRRTIRETRLPQHAPDHANCSRTME
jgi:hypothetical protein